jgi:AcrR family transcriptional regulator
MTVDQRAGPISPLAPRKAPTQRRAHTTVQCILEATEELVKDRGFREVGTGDIAKRAGVSIGSLYQYFPTYESILLAWYEQVAATASSQIKAATVSILDKHLDTALRITVKALLDIYEEHSLVLIRMIKEVPEIEHATSSTSFIHLNRAAMRLFFSQHREYKPRYTEQHIFFAETIITSILRRFVSEKPPFLNRALVLKQVCLLVSAYLQAHRIR